MSPRSAPLELLASLAAVLRDEGVRWYVFGAQAASAHGIPRMTGDVDVTAFLDPSELDRFLAAMERAGFVLRVADPAAFIRRARVLPFEHRPTRMPLDMVLAGPGLEQGFLERAQLTRMGDIEVPVITAEDLIVTKLLAGRAKDLDDVRGVLRQQAGGLSPDRIRATLRELEAAIDQSDLVPLFDRLVAEPVGKGPAPPAGKPRRPKGKKQ